MDVICLKERVSSFQKNNARLTLLESVGSEKKTYIRGKLESETNIYTCLFL